MSGSERTGSHQDLKTSWEDELRGKEVLGIEDISAIGCHRRDLGRSTSTDKYRIPTVMSLSDVVTAVEPGEFDVNNATSMNLTTFFMVCSIEKYKAWPYQHMKNIASFIRFGIRSFLYKCNRETGASSEQPRQQQQYRQVRNRR